ncbi:MAG: tRNA (N(6)-L-threonylcarbamoyladenosine(37)-C(2))-methylthiotransferase MtaB, partial [Bacilli bacterium]|nr:tRNA (N(6)-L-threonylcarbamoyladenosine(37)-C(2))-methylthiotransferase MtaB [Bacilli bacterium]
MEKNKTFNITTFGCKVNSYESEAIKEKLVSEGYAFTNSKKADISVFNTCAVTLVAEKKCLRHIKSVARHNPKCQIVALGCFAQLHPEQLEGIPNVKVLIGSSYKDEISEYLANPQRVINIQRNLRLANYEELKIHYFGSEIRAFEKIQDGCDNFCSYCVIPLTRGRSRSRKCQNILDEVHD